ncbi:MAG TPA: glycine zipper domain-containing protein [Oxalicibacterium sp.]|jgi:uncharacterized protein YcfJ|nr:glycine zipper domain-containing protein [Oxalicibacterium sp.]
MSQKKWIAAALLATAAVSSTAFASDRGVTTALGAVAGALIGNSVGGQDAAVIGGVLGAVVGNSLGDDDSYRHSRRRDYYAAPVYYRQPAYARPYQREVYVDRYDRSYRDVRGDYRRDWDGYRR